MFKCFNIATQHSSSANGHSVRLQLLQAFAMVVKVNPLSTDSPFKIHPQDRVVISL